MTLANIESAIYTFLENDTPEVICIRGKWGVGKTYLWTRCLEEAAKKNSIKLGHYSYISLFGVTSLEDLRLTTVLELEPLAHNQTGTWNKARKLIKRGSKYTAAALDTFAEYKKIFSVIGFKQLPASIICIDDIERKSEQLTIKEILGYASSLRDEKKCKVVILQNSDVLNEADKQQLQIYGEKVIDFDITLDPSPEESTKIAFQGNDETSVMLHEFIEKLRINNIRIIRKIQRHSQQLLVYLPKEKFHADLIRQVLQTLCLFSWSHYDTGPHVPDLNYIKKHNSFDDKKKLNEQQQAWHQAIADYGYSATDELDLEINTFLEKGYIQDSFLAAANQLNAKAQFIALEKQFSDTWRLYHDSLQDNRQEVLNALYDSFKKAAKCISPGNLNGTVKLFQELEDHTKAKELIDYYVEQRSDELNLFDIENGELSFFETPLPEVAEAFKRKYESIMASNSKSVGEIIAEAAEGDRVINRKYEPVLMKASVEDYYSFYKTLHKKNVERYIKICLQYKAYDDGRKSIGTKVEEALKRLAEESLINKRRLSRFIKIAPDKASEKVA